MTLALPLAGWAQCATTAECDAIILENSRKLWELQADSTSTAVQAKLTDENAYNDIQAAGVVVIKAPHDTGIYDPVWIGINIGTEGTITATEKAIAIKLIKENYRGQSSTHGTAEVLIHYGYFERVAELLKAFTE